MLWRLGGEVTFTLSDYTLDRRPGTRSWIREDSRAYLAASYETAVCISNVGLTTSSLVV